MYNTEKMLYYRAGLETHIPWQMYGSQEIIRLSFVSYRNWLPIKRIVPLLYIGRRKQTRKKKLQAHFGSIIISTACV